MHKPTAFSNYCNISFDFDINISLKPKGSPFTPTTLSLLKMPTSKYFDQCPPFPANTPVARLATISLSKLKLGDAGESQKLYNECREWGFFLLNLRDVEEGEALLQDAEQMFHLTEETFALDQSTLDKFAFNPPKDLIGYVSQR